MSKMIRVKWTEEDDRKLIELKSENPDMCWKDISSKMGSMNSKQCRDRWINHLDPNLQNEAPWNYNEEHELLELVKVYGKKWSHIAQILKGRSENSIKNRWYGSLSKRIVKYNHQVDISKPNSRGRPVKRNFPAPFSSVPLQMSIPFENKSQSVPIFGMMKINHSIPDQQLMKPNFPIQDLKKMLPPIDEIMKKSSIQQ